LCQRVALFAAPLSARQAVLVQIGLGKRIFLHASLHRVRVCIGGKQIAQQQALKAEQDLNRIKIEAEQKTVQAQAEAEALRLQKQEITEDLLELRRIEAQLKAIEKWDGKLPTYNGGDAIPFIDITE